MRASIEALAEQTILATRGPIEVIVVDDGSTDRMFEVAKDPQREGKIDSVLRLEHRGGKSAAINLGLSACGTGDIVVISDVDTTFDRSAFAELLGVFLPTRAWAPSAAASAYVMHPLPASSPATRPSEARDRHCAWPHCPGSRLEFFRSRVGCFFHGAFPPCCT